MKLTTVERTTIYKNSDAGSKKYKKYQTMELYRDQNIPIGWELIELQQLTKNNGNVKLIAILGYT
jgi:hypothetical protein